MAAKSKKRAGLAGRGHAVAPSVNAQWALATDRALVQFIDAATAYDPELRVRAEFAARWALDWLIAYSAGWVSGHDASGGSLGATLRHVMWCAKAKMIALPPHLTRALLAVATEAALKTSQAYHGEDKPKTPPNVKVNASVLVESYLFDEQGKQLLTLNQAIGEAWPLLTELFQEACPTQGTVRDWHRSWRASQINLPTLKAGRPRKESSTV